LRKGDKDLRTRRKDKEKGQGVRTKRRGKFVVKVSEFGVGVDCDFEVNIRQPVKFAYICVGLVVKNRPLFLLGNAGKGVTNLIPGPGFNNSG
jgi:hypothetical protein